MPSHARTSLLAFPLTFLLTLMALATVLPASAQEPAAPTSQQDTVEVEDWFYTLRPGDDLWQIALRYCGSGNQATAIAAHNGLQNPTQLRAGQRIAIPVAWLAFAPTRP